MSGSRKTTLMDTLDITTRDSTVCVGAEIDTTGWTAERYERLWGMLGELVDVVHHPKWKTTAAPEAPAPSPDPRVQLADLFTKVPEWAKTIAEARSTGEIDREASGRFGDPRARPQGTDSEICPECTGTGDDRTYPTKGCFACGGKGKITPPKSTVVIEDASSQFVVEPIGADGAAVVVGAGSLLAAVATTAAHPDPDPDPEPEPETETEETEPIELPPVDADLADLALSPVDRLLKLVSVDDLFHDTAPIERHIANVLEMRPPLVKQMISEALDAELITVTRSGRIIESMGITAAGLARHNARTGS